jgi:hypothetical protein
MEYRDPRELVRLWWDAIDRADFDAAIALMSPETIVDWPLSNERMLNPDAWKSVNQNYPGRWFASIQSIVADGDIVVTTTEITDESILVLVISYFTVEAGLITKLVEYWPETYAAPGWRSQWVVPIPA